MLRRRHQLVLVLASGLFFLVLGAIAGASSGTAPGAQKAVEWVREDIQQLRELGFVDGDEKLELLKREEEALLRAIEDPEGQDEGIVEPDLGPGREAEEVACEAMRPFTDGADLRGARCVSVPRSEHEALLVFLTPRSHALAVRITDHGVTAKTFEIPPLPELESASLSVDNTGAIRVLQPDSDEVVIVTSQWSP